MNNQSRTYSYAALRSHFGFVLLPSAVLTLKTTKCHSLFIARSVVRTVRLSTPTPNEGGVERVFSELARGARSAKNGLACASTNCPR